MAGRRTPPADCGRMIDMLDRWLLDDEQKALLADDPLNFFYLHAAACLSSEKAIVEERKVLGIPDISQARLIAEIVRKGHLPPENWPPPLLPKTGDSLQNRPANLLAGALALAERLDLHHPATLERIRRKTASVSGQPDREKDDGFTVEAIGPHPHLLGTVRVRIRCRDAETHRGLKHYETELVRYLARLNERVEVRFLFGEVVFEIRPEGYAPVDYKFVVDGSAALQLFMGNTLYGDKRVFLRELIQNAVDACRLRALFQADYVPAVSVSLDPFENVLTVRDNGIGMDRNWIEKYFLNVGISFYRSEEIGRISKNTALEVGFISNFGIGFLSTFLVARRIRVRTKKAGAPGLSITITDIGDYFDVRRIDEPMPVGTEVVLELKHSGKKPWRSMEFIGYLKTVARFVAVPIAFTDPQGRVTVVGGEPLDSFGTASSIRNFPAALSIEPSGGFVLLRTRGTGARISGLETATGGISIFQNGIFVTQRDELLPPAARGVAVGRINLLGPHRCELSMDRNRIFWQKGQLHALRRAVLRGLASAAGEMLASVEGLNAAPEIRRKVERTVASFFELPSTDDALFETLPAAIRRLLQRKFRSFLRTSVSKTEAGDRDLTAIAAAQGFQYKWQESVASEMGR